MAKIFISYSHADEHHKDDFLKHAANLRRAGNHFWEDRQLLAGDTLDEKIANQLKEAELIIFLVSADFLNSYYCYEIEFQAAMERHQNGTARIIAVILDHCDWQYTPLKNVVNLPQDAKPISDWKNPNQAWNGVIKELRKVLSSFEDSSTPTPIVEVVPQSTVTENRKSVLESPNIPEIRLPPTDLDYRSAARETYTDLHSYFESGVNALNEKNSAYTAEIIDINNQRFVASLYKNGNITHEVVFWIGGLFGGGHGISYYLGREVSHTNENSFSGGITLELENNQIIPVLDRFTIIGPEESKGSVLANVWELFIYPMKSSY